MPAGRIWTPIHIMSYKNHSVVTIERRSYDSYKITDASRARLVRLLHAVPTNDRSVHIDPETLKPFAFYYYRRGQSCTKNTGSITQAASTAISANA